MSRPRTALLLVAAGTGTRLGAEVPKQFLRVAGRAVMRHAADRLAPDVDLIQPVGEAAPIAAALAGLEVLPVVPGGATRQDSVRAGLEALAPHAPEIVLVHDAARPFVPPGTVAALRAALQRVPGAIPAVPVADTLKREGADGTIGETVPRAGLVRAQTPQGFRFPLLLALHRAAPAGATDDAAILEAAGHAVALVAGSEDNIKLTYREDLVRLERVLLGTLMPRVGTGYDVHVLTEGRKLMLCGVEVPFALGLAGHSDADVGIHALCDAIYGALAEGDIGRHFPPSEASLEGCRFGALPAPCGGAHRRAWRGAGQCRCHADLRAAEDQPARAGDDGAAGRVAGGRSGAHLGEGDDDGTAGLHRADGGHRGAGRGHGAGAGLILIFFN